MLNLSPFECFSGLMESRSSIVWAVVSEDRYKVLIVELGIKKSPLLLQVEIGT